MMDNVPADVDLVESGTCPMCGRATRVLLGCSLCETEVCELCMVGHSARHALESAQNPVPAGYLVPRPIWAAMVHKTHPDVVVCSSRFSAALSPLHVLDGPAIMGEVATGASKLYQVATIVVPNVDDGPEFIGACEVMARDTFIVTRTAEPIEGYTQQQEHDGWFLLKRELAP